MTAEGRGPVRIGIDLVEVDRIIRIVDRYDDRELGAVFTPGERASANGSRRRHRRYAICFGAKEAVGKALGVGLGGIRRCDVESVVADRGSSLAVKLMGRAAEIAMQLAIGSWSASFAAYGPMVLVQVVGWPAEDIPPGSGRCRE